LGVAQASVEDYMTSIWKSSIAGFYETAIVPYFSRIGEHKKGIVKLFCVEPTLLPPPTTLGVGSNRLQISFGFLG
jgi:hypothetical protein